MEKLMSWLRRFVNPQTAEESRTQDSSPPVREAGSREEQGQPVDAMDNVAHLPRPTRVGSAFTVEQVVEDGEDSAKNKILCVFTRVPPQYAVYLTNTRVVVQYADDTKMADEQRKEMANLNGLRAQIDGLVDGWRTSRLRRYKAKARKYDMRVAGALALCLEKDGANARIALGDIKDDIVAERTSWGRFEYLIAASFASLIAIAFFFGIQHQVFRYNLPPGDLWLATRAGTVGAFFSIALAIQGRTVLTNLRRRDNVADAILRIVIGTIAAGVLLLMIKAGMLPKFQIGDASLASDLKWQAALIVGFVAGFSERLVPDLLAKSANKEPEGEKKSGVAAKQG